MFIIAVTKYRLSLPLWFCLYLFYKTNDFYLCNFFLRSIVFWLHRQMCVFACFFLRLIFQREKKVLYTQERRTKDKWLTRMIRTHPCLSTCSTNIWMWKTFSWCNVFFFFLFSHSVYGTNYYYLFKSTNILWVIAKRSENIYINHQK